MISVIYSVFCDGEECLAWVGESGLRTEAIECAREYGWVRRIINGRLRDLCSKCAAKKTVKIRGDK